MITQHAWMFLSSYEKLRKKLQCSTTVNMAHLGARAFDEINGEVVQTTAFVNKNQHIKNYLGTYARLIDGKSENEKSTMFLSGIYNYTANADNFSKIPGSPVAYWVSENYIRAFDNKLLESIASCCTGMQTGNNEKYIRFWYEVSFIKTSLYNSEKKYKKYNCGGEYKKWYGNHLYLVNWGENGRKIRNEKSSVIRNEKFFFRKGLSWKRIGSNGIGLRLLPEGFIFDQAGDSMFMDDSILYYVLGYLNSKVAEGCFKFIAPTMNLTAGNMNKLPILFYEILHLKIDNIVEENISLSKADWDSFETSWDFKRHPIVPSAAARKEQEASQFAESRMKKFGLISWHFEKWQQECEERFNKLKANEEELNRIFIDIYGLQDELKPEVEDKDVTVRKADLTREIKSLISYAVGCMFGRYSLDVDGLAYAGGEWDSTKYKSFIPDSDNCIPITDTKYFEDDIVGRFCEFIKVVYGRDTLEENLYFIAQALGNKGNSSREVIRNYFLNDFFKDHCKIYQKRPIYWLFDSGKQNGFKALIYMHRYNADTIGNLRVEYLHRVQHIYESEIEREQDTIDNTTNAREKKVSENRKEKLQRQLKETKEYDEKIAHLALSRIEIDLDDGVKVNYEKVQTGRDGKKLDVLGKI